jgi:purine-nucleoside phosphorylase
MSTPHIDAAPGDFAPVVIMPGDPLRARWVAEEFLTESRQVNAVRNMLGFTGLYRDRPVSVMGSGMGIPSLSIYARELYHDFGVKCIIRAGSCGAVHPDVGLGDIIVAMGASTDSRVNRLRFMEHDFAALADFYTLHGLVHVAKKQGRKIRVGNVFSADLFYTPQPAVFDAMERLGILGVEMEAAGLYGCAAECGRAALAVCTVSDHIRTGAKLTSQERETGLRSMMELVLDTAVSLKDE